jgi:predicted RNA binding protein YcfA (HicA-like mRNA interferase family)
LKPKELIKLLQKNGWNIKRINGSHYILENQDGETEVIPVHNTDMKIGLLNSILKRTGLK